MFEAPALEVGLEFPMDMVGQRFALQTQLIDQCGVVRFDDLVEQRLLGAVTFIANATDGILAIRQHADRASVRCPSCLCSIDEGWNTEFDVIRLPPRSRMLTSIASFRGKGRAVADSGSTALNQQGSQRVVTGAR